MQGSQGACDPKRSRYEVCQKVRRKLILLWFVDQFHHSAYRDIIQVMPWSKCSRTSLSIPADPQQYDSFVDHKEIFWPEPQLFQDSRTIWINQYISVTQQFKYNLKVVLIFEINGYTLFIAIEDVFVDRYGNRSGFSSSDKSHLCTLISKIQSAEDTGRQSLKFHYFELLHRVIYLIYIPLIKILKQPTLSFRLFRTL